MPKEYLFLLIGLVAGGLLGAWIGRAWGIASAASKAFAGQPPGAAQPGQGGLPPGISLVVNGETVDVSAETLAEVQTLLRARKAPEALQALRESTGLGMAEAKAVLESLEKVMR